MILLLLLACAHGPDLSPKGLLPASTTAEALSRELEPRRFALLVGVDDYDDPTFTDLRHARDDAELLGEVLRAASVGAFDEVTVLPDASRDEVLAALRRIAADLRRRDTVVVYFSGHGTRILDGETWRRR